MFQFYNTKAMFFQQYQPIKKIVKQDYDPVSGKGFFLLTAN